MNQHTVLPGYYLLSRKMPYHLGLPLQRGGTTRLWRTVLTGASQTGAASCSLIKDCGEKIKDPLELIVRVELTLEQYECPVLPLDDISIIYDREL